MPACTRAADTLSGRLFGAVAQTAAGTTENSKITSRREAHVTTGCTDGLASFNVVQDCAGASDQNVHLVFVDDIRRHEINGISQWPQQQSLVQCRRIKPAWERGMLRFDIECPDHAGIAELADTGMLNYLLTERGHLRGLRPICCDHVVLREDVQ